MPGGIFLPAAIYPKGSEAVIFSDGFGWGILLDVPGTLEDRLRMGGIAMYHSGLVPGWILPDGRPQDPKNPEVRVYRIRRDYLTVSDEELRRDAASLLYKPPEMVTESEIEALREQYRRDWEEWPVHLGAPFNDRNGNGMYDPGIDEPGIADADQVIWLVANDLDTFQTQFAWSSLPLGIELQITWWAYDLPGALGQTHFRRYRLINKGSHHLDSLYIGPLSELDLGEYEDDLVGCDSILEAGFVYNGTENDRLFSKYGLPPPAAGYVLLQGVIVPAPGDTAIFDFRTRPGFRNLPLRSFSYAVPNIFDPHINDHHYRIFNTLRGFQPLPDLAHPQPFRHGAGPLRGRETRFPLNGDPVTGTGDVAWLGDNPGPDDYRIYMGVG
ncbi:MAG: hypothetical protein D6681_13150, partial [Calditrichaeota bacterium]